MSLYIKLVSWLSGYTKIEHIRPNCHHDKQRVNVDALTSDELHILASNAVNQIKKLTGESDNG